MAAIGIHSGPQAQRVEALEGHYDPLLMLSAGLLAVIGIVMVGSSSVAVAEGLGVGQNHFLIRHLVFLSLGLALAVILCRVELKVLERHSRLLLLGCFVLVGLVFVPGIGHTVNGAQRWINLGVSNFQAVEAVKVLLILWLASYLKRHGDAVAHSWAGLLKPIGIMVVLVLALLAQPDFGSVMLIGAVFGGMLFLGGASLPRLLLLGSLALPLLAWLAVTESYRLRRLTSFLNPWADPFDNGFQLTQALIAIGRGEWFGVGLGASIQKLFYLPEAHTDFILSVLAEELGFVGVLVVITLFAVFAGRCLWIGYRALEMSRRFAGLVACGVGLWIGLQALVSIGVNFGVLPTKGLTLPLVSSGGSSVLMTCVAIGLVLRVSYELERAQRQVAHHRAELALESFQPMAIAPGAGSADRGKRERVEPRMGATV